MKDFKAGKDNTNTTYGLESQGSFVIDENYLDTLMEDKTTSRATVNTKNKAVFDNAVQRSDVWTFEYI